MFQKMMAESTHELVLSQIEDGLGLGDEFEAEGLIDDVIGFTFGAEFEREDQRLLHFGNDDPNIFLMSSPPQPRTL